MSAFNFKKCKKCKYNIPPPINDCAKHQESGALIGEVVKCRSVTENPFHVDYFEKRLKRKRISRTRGERGREVRF